MQGICAVTGGLERKYDARDENDGPEPDSGNIHRTRNYQKVGMGSQTYPQNMSYSQARIPNMPTYISNLPVPRQQYSKYIPNRSLGRFPGVQMSSKID